MPRQKAADVGPDGHRPISGRGLGHVSDAANGHQPSIWFWWTGCLHPGVAFRLSLSLRPTVAAADKRRGGTSSTCRLEPTDSFVNLPRFLFFSLVLIVDVRRCGQDQDNRSAEGRTHRQDPARRGPIQRGRFVQVPLLGAGQRISSGSTAHIRRPTRRRQILLAVVVLRQGSHQLDQQPRPVAG